MCGFSAIIYKNTELKNEHELQNMTNIIAHRGPDDFGYYVHNNICLGHRRLSIIDLSKNASQPMHWFDKYTIVYNGEIYNYIEIRKQLEKKGYTFKTKSDTEVILAAYDYWKDECVHQFNGMWAFIILNKKENIAFCSRDRMGIKPFYYTNINNKIALASEIKQFSCLQEWKAQLNQKTAYHFLAYGLLDHASGTFFKNVFQLRGGENLTISLSDFTLAKKKWYYCNKTNALNEQAAIEKFRELFHNSVNIRLRSDVNVGSCLSGGLDSSSIVYTMHQILSNKNAENEIHTVSSCYNSQYKKFDEQYFINLIDKQININSHKVFPQLDELFRNLNTIIYHQDEPFSSTSIFAQWSVFEAAKKQNLKVMLDGQGADELLSGYHGYYNIFWNNLLKNFKLTKLINEIKSFHQLANEKDVKLIHRYYNVLKNTYIEFYLGMKKRINGISKIKNTSNGHFLNIPFQVNPFPHNNNDLNYTLHSHLFHSNLQSLLHWEDRNSMAFSIESRVPFLDYRIVELVNNLPYYYKIKNGITKYLLREALKPFLAPEIYSRFNKLGFATPEELWMRERKELFRKELKKSIDLSNGLISENILLHFEDMINNKIPFSFIFWRYIVFGKWMSVFNIKI